jgi:hypothetical protein
MRRTKATLIYRRTKNLHKLGATPMTMAQPAFAKFLEDETTAAAGPVKAAGLKLD